VCAEDLIARLKLTEVPIADEMRQRIRKHGLGQRWDTVKQVHAGETDAIALIELSEAFTEDLGKFTLHPALLDTAIGYANWHLGGQGLFLPLSYEKIRVNAPLPARFYSHVHFPKADGSTQAMLRYDVRLIDSAGRELLCAVGVEFRRIDEKTTVEPRDETASDSVARFVERIAGKGIRPNDGVAALGRIIASGIGPQVIVSLQDPAQAIEEAGQLPSTLEEIGTISQRTDPRPDLHVEYVAPYEGFETQLATIWAQCLGVERVGRNDNFFELGGDSVVAIQMIAKAHHLGFKLTPQQLFRHQTIAHLASVIAGSTQATASVREVATAPPPDSRRGFSLSGLDEAALGRLARQAEAADE
jgi:aryl carrier-like protein